MKNYLNHFIRIINVLFNKKFLRKPDFSEKKMILLGKINESNNYKKKTISNLSKVEFSTFSQFGEDGIISWLLKQIPNVKKTFLEIGTQDYWESNTRFLIQSHNWNGYIIEASSADVRKIKTQGLFWKKNLIVINKFVTKENINSIIQKNFKNIKFGLFSLDIDGNDYWILKQVDIKSDLIVCEYNPIFGDIHELTIPYEKDFDRSKKHYSNLFFGCSIQALISLMRKKGYLFLGTNSEGMNAFFVDKKKIKYLKDKIKEKKIFFPILREGRSRNSKLNYKKLFENLHLIKNKKVYDIKRCKIIKLSEIQNLYSEKWKKFN